MWSLLRTCNGRAGQDGRERQDGVFRPGLPALVLAVLALPASAATAQSVERFTIDSVASIDLFGGDNVSNRPQIIVDISAGVRLGDHWQVVFRPWFRQARPTTPGGGVPPWDAEIYQAGV